MKEIYIYNTLSRKKEVFKPLEKGSLSFYYCGPTVYWTQHIGNLRGSLCADIVHRVFRYLNYEVNMVRNYTDVGHLSSDEDAGEDKLDLAAKRENLEPSKIAQKYLDIYEQDVKDLNILDPKFKPKATDNINEMIDFIQVLMAKGYAYATNLAIYFDISKFDKYTELSRQKLEKNRMGAGKGLVNDSSKRNQADFALWFFKTGDHKNVLQYWESPFVSPLVEKGYGFPGWHLECSAMIERFLGDTIDIHMGGVEHISVHHTNEIAQSECAHGVKLANYWIHNEHLLVNDAKMSKSEGTSYSLADIKSKSFKVLALRYFFLQAHYRSQQNFSFEALKSSQKGLSSLYHKIAALGSEVGLVSQDFKARFLEDVLDDFNVTKSLALISEILKSDLSPADKLATLLDFDNIWALDLKKAVYKDDLSMEVEKIVNERNLARENKDFDLSDKLRLELESMGYRVEDGEGETKLYKL